MSLIILLLYFIVFLIMIVLALPSVEIHLTRSKIFFVRVFFFNYICISLRFYTAVYSLIFLKE